MVSSQPRHQQPSHTENAVAPLLLLKYGCLRALPLLLLFATRRPLLRFKRPTSQTLEIRLVPISSSGAQIREMRKLHHCQSASSGSRNSPHCSAPNTPLPVLSSVEASETRARLFSHCHRQASLSEIPAPRCSLRRLLLCVVPDVLPASSSPRDWKAAGRTPPA